MNALPCSEAEWKLIIDKEEEKRRPNNPEPSYIGSYFSFRPAFPDIWIKSDTPIAVAEEVVATEFANTHVKSFASPRILGVRPSGTAFAKTEIAGITLESCLASLDQSQLDFIVHDLAILIAEMRSLPKRSFYAYTSPHRALQRPSRNERVLESYPRRCAGSYS